MAYFLGPGTAWELQFEDVITQVLKENWRHNEKKRTDAASSLRKCRNWRTKLCDEFDAVSQAMEMTTDAPSSRELEHRLNTLQTSLDVVERSITKFENLIEDCWRLEEEARRVEEDEARCKRRSARSRRRRSPTLRWLMRKSAVMPSPLPPCGEADTEGLPPLVSAEDAVSPEEDALLMQPASQPEDPTTGSHSPRSETGTVSGEMAKLCLTSPSQPGHEEDETQP